MFTSSSRTPRNSSTKCILLTPSLQGAQRGGQKCAVGKLHVNSPSHQSRPSLQMSPEMLSRKNKFNKPQTYSMPSSTGSPPQPPSWESPRNPHWNEEKAGKSHSPLQYPCPCLVTEQLTEHRGLSKVCQFFQKAEVKGLPLCMTHGKLPWTPLPLWPVSYAPISTTTHNLFLSTRG